LEADLYQAKLNVEEYASIPRAKLRLNRYLIEHVDTHAGGLIALSLKHRQAFFVSLVGMSYLLIARQALFEDDRASGHILTLQPVVDGFLKTGSENFQYLLTRLAPSARITIVDGEDSGALGQDLGNGYRTPDIPGYYFSSVRLDGNEVGWFSDDR